MGEYTEERLRELRDSNEHWLMSLEGVTGTGIGLGTDGRVCLRIFMDVKNDATRRAIEERLGAVPIEWEIGEVVPYQGTPAT